MLKVVNCEQVVIGRFIADFAAPTARLVVEVDGEYPSRRRTADARRDRVLRRLGYRVLRFEASSFSGIRSKPSLSSAPRSPERE
jgi:very-short-patch-repair endonuclease